MPNQPQDSAPDCRWEVARDDDSFPNTDLEYKVGDSGKMKRTGQTPGSLIWIGHALVLPAYFIEEVFNIHLDPGKGPVALAMPPFDPLNKDHLSVQAVCAYEAGLEEGCRLERERGRRLSCQVSELKMRYALCEWSGCVEESTCGLPTSFIRKHYAELCHLHFLEVKDSIAEIAAATEPKGVPDAT